MKKIIIFMFMALMSLSAVSADLNISLSKIETSNFQKQQYSFEDTNYNWVDLQNAFDGDLNSFASIQATNPFKEISVGYTFNNSIRINDLYSKSWSNGASQTIRLDYLIGSTWTQFHSESLTPNTINELNESLNLDVDGVRARIRTADSSTRNYRHYEVIPYAFIDSFNENGTSFFNSENITININSDENKNISYRLNNALFIDLCILCNTTDLNLNSLVDGVYNLTIKYNDLEYDTNFTIDTTNPTIINNIPTEINYFTLNDSLFSCNDTNIDTCQISINSQTVDFDQSISFTDSGILPYTITATDLGGNTIQEQGTILVNPYAYFYFEAPDTAPIGSFSLDGVIYTDYAQIKYYNDGLTIGENTLEFESLGFAITNIDFNLSSGSPNFNQTFTVQDSKIVLNIYDFETGNLMNTNVDITLIETSYTNTVSSGTINISDISFYDGEYQLILESTNYETQILYFEYSNKEVLNLDAYLIATNATNLGVLNVKAESTTNPIEGQLVNLLSWDTDSSSYITVGQSKTNSNGDAFFNVLLGNTVYKVNAVRNGEIETAPEQIIYLSGTVIFLYFGDNLEDYPTYNTNGITYSLINQSFNATHDLITFTFTDNFNLVTNVCLDVNRIRNSYRTQLSSNCVTTSSGEIQIYTSINNSFTKEVVAKVYYNDQYFNLNSITYSTSLTLENGLGNLSKWLALAMMVALLALGVYIENINLVGVGTIIGSWVVYSIFNNTMSYTVPLLITIIMILVLYGTFKKRF